MANRFILTDGQKSANLLTSNDPSVWSYFSGGPTPDSEKLYARVSAAFRAYNLKANTVGNMPFVLYRGKTEFDTSATWENKVGFLPNPSELFRLDTLSYMDTNTIYNLRTSDVLGRKQKGLYHAVARTFQPETDPATGQLARIVRQVSSQIEYYTPDDKRLFRAWRLDHTTEVLPSPHTEAGAIMNAAGVIYNADTWIKHFFERGGVSPTVIGMKGAVQPERRDEEEKKWTDWLLGLGRFRARIARVFNAETLDVKQFGSSVTELKDNEVYNQALANIAMGTGMPLSLLLANSSNYATAKEEKATWYENDIIPLCNWLAYEYNRQVFEPLGLRLEFHPETLDPQQEDETERAQAINAFMDFLAKCPTYDVFIGACETFGYELSDNLIAAAEKYYQDKEKRAEEVQAQMGEAGYVVGADNQPIPVQAQEQADEPEPEEDDEEEETPPAKSALSLDDMELLTRWREIANRRMKRGDSLDFVYTRESELPAGIVEQVKSKLVTATTHDDIAAAFAVEAQAEVKTIDPLLELAASINRLAEAQLKGANNGAIS